MSAAFTPGPWAVNPLVAQVDCQTISEKGGLLPVAQMLWPTDERAEDETEANARLIAAAPELFEAVAAFVDRIDSGDRADTDYVIGLMNAALAKARGES